MSGDTESSTPSGDTGAGWMCLGSPSTLSDRAGRRIAEIDVSLKDLLDFTLFRKKRQDVTEYIDGLDLQIRQLGAELVHLQRSAADREDVKLAVRQAVKRLAGGFDADVAKAVAQLAREADRLEQAAFVDAVLAGGVPGLRTKEGDGATSVAPLLAALMGEALIERMEQVIDAAPWPANARSSRARQARQAEIAAQLEQLRKTRSEAQAAAESAGLSL